MKNEILEEFIGKQMQIISAPNKSQIDKKGLVVMETKNTITLLVENKRVQIAKKGVIVEIESTQGEMIYIDLGSTIASHEDRSKKNYRGMRK